MTRTRMRGTFTLPAAIYDEMIAHARSDFPYETCGLLAGRDGAVLRHYVIPNAARSMTYYEMDPKAMLQAMKDLDAQEWDLLGIWHSHTHTEAFPSRTDVELAFYPGTCYLILSLQDDEPALRAFDIDQGTISERVLTVDGAGVPAGPR